MGNICGGDKSTNGTTINDKSNKPKGKAPTSKQIVI